MPGPTFSTAEKLIDVLLLFQNHCTDLSVDEISNLLGLPRSTAYRYIRILRERGFLEKSSADGYNLGPRLLQLGRIARRNFKISNVALPVMEEIAHVCKETVLLTQLFGDSAVCIERIEGPGSFRVSFEVGQVHALHAGASSKILLAFINEDEWERRLRFPLERFTDHTITDFHILKKQLQMIRQMGYCTSESEVEVGIRSIAVPIFNVHGNVDSALSIVGPFFRIDDAAISRYLELLKSGADKIHQQLVLLSA
jgi:DNA-binding IclR family transcriptional regulator